MIDGLRHELAFRYRSEERSTKEIAYLLGFSTPGHFTRAFRRWTGASLEKNDVQGLGEA